MPVLNGLIEMDNPALASAAQWVESGTANQRVSGSIPSHGTCLGCRPGPQVGDT